jgi:hypothetical protein
MGVSFAAIIVAETLPLADNGIMLHTVEHVNI